MKVIRGQRLLDWLEEDSTYQQLDTNIQRGFPDTKKRQHVTSAVAINRIEYIPYIENGELHVQAVAVSSGNQYQPTVAFRNVTFEPEDQPTNTTFRAVDNNEYHIQSIPLNVSNVRVRCNCLDFYYRFAAWNAGDNSLAGRPATPYRATGQRPPVNPLKVPGVCKHVIKVIERLKQGRFVT